MILQIIGTLRGGGAERVALTLHKAFTKLYQNSKILVLNEKTDYNINDKNIIFEKNILEFINKNNPELVIAHMQDTAEILQPIKNQKNIWFVIHTTISQRLKQKNIFSRYKLQKKFISIYKNSNIITVSNGIKKDLEQFKLNANIKTIYNPFNIEEIKKLGNEKIDLNFEYIISVGNMTKIKRQDLIIKAFSKLNNPNLHLVLLGKGNQEKNLKKLVKQLNLENKVHFLGWQENPYKYIKNAKLFVLASEIEGFGNVLVESLILNTPIVSTNCPSGPNEILINELSKFLVKVGDVNELKEKIELALNNYPKIEQKYYQNFDYLTIAKQYKELI